MKDSQECHHCESHYWSNEGRDGCVPLPEEFLAYTDPIAIVLLSFALLGLFLVLGISLLIFKHRELSAVKAAGFGVYAVLLMALAGCFCSNLLFVGRPSVAVCRWREAGTTAFIALNVSCLMQTTISLLIANKGNFAML